jgi:hypothetical protein
MTDRTETEINMTENGLYPLTSRDESIVRLLAGHEEISSYGRAWTFPVKIFARGASLLIKGER